MAVTAPKTVGGNVLFPSPGDRAAFQAASQLAPLASPAFEDEPTAPTPAPGDDSDRLATTAFVTAAVAAGGGGGGGGGGGRTGPLPSVYVPGAVSWAPLAGCTDAADAAVSADGTPVKGWLSEDGSGLLVQPTANKRPLWKANAGFPYLRFDGASDDLGDFAVSAGGLLIGVAFRTTTLGRAIVSAYTAGPGFGPMLFVAFSSGVLSAYDPANGLDSAAGVADGNWHRAVLYSGPSGAGRRLWLDGALAAGGGSTSATTPTGVPVRVGDTPAGGYPFAGDMGKLIVAPCNACPSDAAFAALDFYLATDLKP